MTPGTTYAVVQTGTQAPSTALRTGSACATGLRWRKGIAADGLVGVAGNAAVPLCGARCKASGHKERALLTSQKTLSASGMTEGARGQARVAGGR
jgi:hypothetical protein